MLEILTSLSIALIQGELSLSFVGIALSLFHGVIFLSRPALLRTAIMK